MQCRTAQNPVANLGFDKVRLHNVKQPYFIPSPALQQQHQLLFDLGLFLKRNKNFICAEYTIFSKDNERDSQIITFKASNLNSARIPTKKQNNLKKQIWCKNLKNFKMFACIKHFRLNFRKIFAQKLT